MAEIGIDAGIMAIAEFARLLGFAELDFYPGVRVPLIRREREVDERK